ncbi:hypothetical protein EOL70_13485 [Leucothrix sargassi]|nr:hypothetical protein EOL70_13485 [Leucothrix sargassi]
MDPQLVALTETLATGIDQHKQGMAFHREKGEGFAAAQAENKEKTDLAISELSIAIVSEMQRLANGFFERYVSPDGDDATADLTSNKPFRTLKAAVDSTPKGTKTSIKFLAQSGHPIFEVGSSSIDVGNRELSIWYQGQLAGDYGTNATLLFTADVAGNGNTIVNGFNGTGTLLISGVTMESDVIGVDTPVAGGWITNNFNGLSVRLWAVTISCSKVPFFNGSVGGKFNVAIVNSAVTKNGDGARLGYCDHQSSIDFVTAGSFTAEGTLSDYFSAAQGDNRYTWNRNPFTGTL